MTGTPPRALTRTLQDSGRRVRAVRPDRVVTAAAAIAGIVLVLVATPVLVRAAVPLAIAFVLAAALAGCILLALRAPRLALIGSLAIACAVQALTAGSSGAWPWSPVLIVVQVLVFAAAGTRVGPVAALVAWLAAVTSSAVLAAVLRPDAGARSSVDLVVFGGVAAAVLVVVLLLAQWQRVRGLLLQERRITAEASAARAAAEERTRIARELHDVVAHSLSLITVQASTAKFRNAGVDAESAVEFDRIAAQSRTALDEMRGLLHVLRGSEDDADRSPQPGLRDLGLLVEQAAEAGADVVLDQPGPGWQDGIDPVVGLAAFRIVQEATSNALRHAPGSPVRISLTRTGSEVEIVVIDEPGAGRPPVDAAPGGHGLIGMRERAESTGGTMWTTTTTAGGFAVHARLPASGPVGSAA